ncbi:DUF4434 domain-containing protein [Actinocrispum wychmicini]|uniref:Uncharacterized protein DUF4434 n=1 Tax=Actinocrispum wychmicini TaxID=1213861 RepID=A0A4R2JEX1_9PSEU|nr:DUF4434 domain-containing protein [Actinocrispum wychmicini]TCO54799.1 uncharacterized protein DUF4434 [Actinocrispum wychmicini]
MPRQPKPRRTTAWWWLAAVLVVVVATSLSVSARDKVDTTSPCAKAPAARLGASFVQPTIDAADGRPWRADQAVAELADACVDTVTIQWTAYMTNAQSWTSYGGTLDAQLADFTQGPDFVTGVLEAAKARHMKVYLGLVADDRTAPATPNWRALWNFTPQRQLDYLTRQAAIQQAVARDLWNAYGTRFADTIAGWYLPLELSNITVLHPAVGQPGVTRIVTALYQPVVSALDVLTGRRLDVVTSPAFNTCTGQLDRCQATDQQPADQNQVNGWYRTLRSIVSCGGPNVLAVQDGVGAGHASSDDSVTWLRAAAAAIRDGARSQCDLPGVSASPRAGARLRAVIETFKPNPQAGAAFVPGPVLPSDGPDDWTTRMTRIANDPVIRASGVWSDEIWGFSYEHYDSPQAGYPTQHRQYRRYLGLLP